MRQNALFFHCLYIIPISFLHMYYPILFPSTLRIRLPAGSFPHLSLFIDLPLSLYVSFLSESSPSHSKAIVMPGSPPRAQLGGIRQASLPSPAHSVSSCAVEGLYPSPLARAPTRLVVLCACTHAHSVSSCAVEAYNDHTFRVEDY